MRIEIEKLNVSLFPVFFFNNTREIIIIYYLEIIIIVYGFIYIYFD